MLSIRVKVYHSAADVPNRGSVANWDGHYAKPYRSYVMDHDDQAQRRVLGEQCRNAFEAGQTVVTSPEPK